MIVWCGVEALGGSDGGVLVEVGCSDHGGLGERWLGFYLEEER